MKIRPAFVRCQVISRLHRRPALLGDRGPMVSFTFDDFPRTAYSVGGAILEALGVRGTYYTAVGLMNSTSEVGEQFQIDDVLSLVERGHELASHTFRHISCHGVSVAEFHADVNRGQDALSKITGIQPANFAYPFGDVSLAVKKDLGSTLGSSRSIFGGFNGPCIDLNLLRANRLYGDRDNLGQAEELIAENARRKSWLIFFTHDVCPRPSPWGCTPELLQSAAAFAVRNGSRVLTVQDALAEVGVAGVNGKTRAYSMASRLY